jgi:Fur family ferric uptake transcriptional regulator
VGGFRMTRQRRVILEEVQKVHTHPTAGEVCDMVRRRLPRISLATVYRSLDALAEQGLLRKLEMGGAQRRFDADLYSHQHVRCVLCGRVENVEVDLPPEVALPRQNRGFEVTSCAIEYLGVCPDCQTTGQ